MAKTKPIGVRFDEELLNKLKLASIVDSPQKALNLYEKSYLELIELKIKINKEPENKMRILEERQKVVVKNFTQPQIETNFTINTERIAELEKDLATIPDKTKGLGKHLADSISKKIFNLKYP